MPFNEKLKDFAQKNRMKGKGPLCVALGVRAMTPVCPHCGGAPSGYRQSKIQPWSVRCRACAHNATAPTLKEALKVWARGESMRHDAAKGETS